MVPWGSVTERGMRRKVFWYADPLPLVIWVLVTWVLTNMGVCNIRKFIKLVN